MTGMRLWVLRWPRKSELALIPRQSPALIKCALSSMAMTRVGLLSYVLKLKQKKGDGGKEGGKIQEKI